MTQVPGGGDHCDFCHTSPVFTVYARSNFTVNGMDVFQSGLGRRKIVRVEVSCGHRFDCRAVHAKGIFGTTEQTRAFKTAQEGLRSRDGASTARVFINFWSGRSI